MKVFVDDLRLAPDNTWTLVRTNTEAIRLLATGHVEAISIDHDICVPNVEFIGKAVRKRLKFGEETFQPVVYYIAAMKPEDRPKTIRIHTANPAGGMRMAGILNDVGVECEVKESSCPFDGLDEKPNDNDL